MQTYNRPESLYKVNGQLKASFDVYITRESKNAPSIKECRHAALHIRNKTSYGYVVYDRLLNRIVDGVYYGENAKENALGVAQLYNEGMGKLDMSPNGVALGLIYPERGQK